MRLIGRCMALIGLLAACATDSGVVPMGDGVYMVAKQAGTGFPGLGNLKADALTEANAYCLARGLSMSLVSSDETKPPYVLGNYPRVEIHFKCA